MPDVNGRPAGGVTLNNTSPWLQPQTFPASGIKLTGTGSNLITLASLASTARTITFPDATGTVALLGAQMFTGAQTFPASGIILTGSSNNTTFASLATGARTITFPDATATVAITNANNSFTATQTITITAIGTAAIAGATWVNTTAAGAGAQQGSPALQLSGQGWKTTATAGSQQCDWQIQCQPIQGTTSPFCQLNFGVQINGGGYVSQGVFGGGGLSAPGSNNGVIFGPISTITWAAWCVSIIPSGTNYSIASNSSITSVNTPTGGTVNLQVNGSSLVSVTSTTFIAPKITTYNSIATAGIGVPAVYGLDNRTGRTTADGAPTTLYTATAANQIYRISADIFATASVTGTANYTITWTENSTTQTALVSATAINVLGTSTQIIRPDNGTAITAQLLGTFTGTFSVVGAVEQLA